MSLHILSEKLWFPPTSDALSDGLLAIGGDLSVERLLLAYKCGIFPWFENDIPLWWTPNPRFVLFPEKLKIRKSMKNIFNKNIFRFTMNKDFEAVIDYCKNIKRHNQDGTWISGNIKKSYTELFHQGCAISAETWNEKNELVGGLYGVYLGKIFFGESMFSLENNASKFAFISLIQTLLKENLQLIDCQVYTKHLESLGAEMIDRIEFERILQKYIE